MKKRIIAIFFACIFALSTLTSYTSYAAAPSITSYAAILMDADTGEILYARNIDEQLYPASITKVMTALLALENGVLEDEMTMSYEAVFSIERGSSHVALDVDEKITLEQALYALLLMSANDAANGIAEYIGGSIDEFAVMMTERAKELGATSTSFKNPHGLYNENHYTTARDMALIAREALKFDMFKTIIGTKNYNIPPTNKQEDTRYFYNQHKMLRPQYAFEGILGGKTGFTDQSRHTLVTYAEQDGTTLVSVVMKAESQDIMYQDTLNLMNYGFNEMAKYTFNKANSVIATLPIFNDLNDNNEGMNKLGYVDIIALEDFTFYGDSTIDESAVTKIYDFNQPLLTPIYKDEKMGSVRYIYKGTELGAVPVTVGQTYEKIDTSLMSTFSQSISKNKASIFTDGLYVLIIAIIFFVLLLLVMHLVRRVRKKKRF